MYNIWTPSYEHGGNSKDHPSPLYESEYMSGASLPKIKTRLHLKNQQPYCSHYISNAQVETIACAVDTMYSKRSIDTQSRGFLLGDGTGVGKTKTIAGVVSELWMINPTNFRAIWISMNKNLGVDAKKELSLIQELGNNCPNWLSLKNIKNNESGILFTTYGSMIRSQTYDVVLNWMVNTHNTLLIFDEAHAAKNSSSKSGKMVVNIQRTLHNPRVVYSTATAASDIRQLHYIEKLGLWAGNHTTFTKTLEKYGSSAMEMCALQLKHTGKLVSRHLGFNGIQIELKTYVLNNSEVLKYDRLMSIWNNLNVSCGIDTINFYQQLITNFKVKATIREIQTSIERDEQVVIGLQTTGENSFKINNKSFLRDLMERHGADLTADDINKNPIDTIIDIFGSDIVAEVSGRIHRPRMGNDGCFYIENVPNTQNEIDDFQNDKKKIIIITRSGSNGISLHSNREMSLKKRHHIILEPPRSAELLVQQFGRTHRTNSAKAPRYTIVVTDIPSEIRFFNGLSTKLERLGAITKGDRRTSLLNNVNFEGCSSISSKSYLSFNLDLNVQIAKKWCDVQPVWFDDLNISSVLSGLYHNDYSLNKKEERTIVFFSKILFQLNKFAIDPSLLEDGVATPVMLNWSVRRWSYLWRELTCDYTMVHMNSVHMNRVSLYCLYKCCFKAMSEYLPSTKHWFVELNSWTIDNHNSHSNYVKKTVKTILLCKIRPECTNTIGALPTHLIYEIIPWLVSGNEFSKLTQIDINSCFKNKSNESPNANVFLNKLFAFPIRIQKIVLPILRSHIQQEGISCPKSSIPDIQKYILKGNNKLKLNFESFTELDHTYILHVSASPLMSLEDHSQLFLSWKSRIIKFVRHEDHVNKYGALVNSNNDRWFCELWYPGHTTPARCFMLYQWQHEASHYIDISITDSEWMDSLCTAYHTSLRNIHKYEYKLIFAVANAISNWEYSTGKLIKVHDTGVSPDFIGLLMRKQKIR